MSAISSHHGDHRAATGGTESVLSPPTPRGVLLLNLGTPEKPDTASVRRYLVEFLSDPEVIRLPRGLGWLNDPVARLIAQLRGPRSAEAYRSIWTDQGSPLRVITAAQVEALRGVLPRNWEVFAAMRYGEPSVGSVLETITARGVRDLVVIPMYPQYSGPTTGTALRQFYDHLRHHAQLSVTVHGTWYDDAGYIDAQARLICEQAAARGLTPANCLLLYSTHALPESYIRGGDPYQQHVLRTVELVTERLGWEEDRTAVSYQSKLGPVPWLRPSTEQVLAELAAAGERNALVCPVSFTVDCLETLEEIGIGYRRSFEAAGGGALHLCPCLNTFEPFVKALAALARRGPHPVGEAHAERPPLMRGAAVTPGPADAGLEGLVMVGASQAPRLNGGGGPSLRHVTAARFQRVKKPHAEVVDLLRRASESGDFEECLLWNTCSRFELYGWTAGGDEAARGAAAVQRMARSIGGGDGDLAVNVLRGREAWHHLLRTAAGLNSGLPGDGELVNQLHVARRLARRCGTDGPRTEVLLQQVQDDQERLETRTDWPRFRLDYCRVALGRLAPRLDLDRSGARYVVVGGSVTARSIIEVLRRSFGVPARQVTAVHRTQCRGRQMKRLRAALGNGVRLRVDRYRDRRVLEAVAGADVVFFAIDARAPVLEAGMLKDLRDDPPRALTIIDFNTFGSTAGMAALPEVHLVEAACLEAEVGQFARSLMECPAFAAAVAQAEATIRRHVAELLNEPVPGEPPAPAPEPGPLPPPPLHAGRCPGGGCPAMAVCPCGREEEDETCPRRLLTMSERIAS